MTPKNLNIEYGFNGEIESITDNEGNFYNLVSIRKRGRKVEIMEV